MLDNLRWPEPDPIRDPNSEEKVKTDKETDKKNIPPPIPTIGSELASILQGKSKDDLKKIFGEDLPDNLKETLNSTDEVEDGIPKERRGTI